ncbi:MAG: UDP-N-acetylmuramyl-tripeptide synthetase [bacterium]|nr:UDP-N-acetylmuramyl-tripeptide synthetase [bacterium]
MKQFIKSLTPEPILHFYYYSLATLGAVFYGFPSRKLFVIGVTGTKGKSTTTELVAAILKEAGHTVAVASTIRFSIGRETEPNLFKMTMPGRFFLQRFLSRAVSRGATHAVVEMTSEGARQCRHKWISLNALIFTNLAPEHIESHGSFEKYKEAKLSLAKHLEASPKRPRYIVANADDKHGKEFLDTNVEHKLPFSLADAEPYSTGEKAVRFVWKKGELLTVPLPGVFNLKNILAAMTLCEAIGVRFEDMKKALEHIEPIPGRAERVERGQPFTVVVDYAHTPDSLRALFETYASTSLSTGAHKRTICVIGSTGGGRDTWNRPEKGKAAEEFCDTIFITNEDPYDEDPQAILNAIAKGVIKKKPYLMLDRRSAIREALKEAKSGDAVLITGKGTDPFIMGPKGTKEKWSDKRVAEEELKKLGHSQEK